MANLYADEKVRFYREWLPLPKNDFRVLAMLADKGGSFKGSLADICRCLSISTGQAKTNAILRASIDSLTTNGYIKSQREKNTYHLEIVPKADELGVARQWVDDVLYKKKFGTESVAWEQVLKVLIWIYNHPQEQLITNAEISADLNVSVNVVVSAKNVLEREFQSISREVERHKDFNGDVRTMGQYLGGCTTWSRE